MLAKLSPTPDSISFTRPRNVFTSGTTATSVFMPFVAAFTF
ncbi:Uncharacterised protein [Mycobacteroides abscessus]|nr:Uncharacterised protein [Mycobacteroides abscessus]CPS67711.1 Uncharacterised protein [Mycobacteroides abscessus]CPY52697.1 Uncharacterised protein [Mycobacteroides abscessus]CPY53454.1 Uncharacterised protein [Mycobacteroides abscessus]